MPHPTGHRATSALCLAGFLALSACSNGSGSQTATAPPNPLSTPPSIAGSTGNEGWYSADQAAQGKALFAQKCAVCHGAELEGGAGPALAGNQFFLRYRGKPLSELWATIHTQMPLSAPGTLSTAQSLAIVAFILQQNGFHAGSSPLMGSYDITRIIPAAAPGTTAAAAAGANAEPVPMVVKQPTTDVPSQQQLESADVDATDWLTYGKGYRGARYSSLSDITAANVARVKPVCSVQLSPGGSFEGSPAAYDGTLYVTTTNGTFAIDGRTCAKVWSYQYSPTDIAAGANNKGVAIGGGRVIRGTVDGHLIALDIKTGELLWDRKIMDSSTGASAMAAPLIWHDLVFMGTAGGDVGIRGDVTAYRVTDGTKVWSFSTIPTTDEAGASSWQTTAASHGGGGVWTYFTLDPKTATIFVPVGNPGPDFNRSARPGANLFTTGIVAIDAGSGKLRWWYQTEPNDDHDWDATGTAQFDTTNGKQLLVATGKDGLIHVIDRASGKLLAKTATTTIANADAPITTAGTHYCPGVTGGSEWNGAAWNPQTRLIYVNSVDWCVTVKRTKLASIKNINAAGKVESGSAAFGGGIPIPDPMAKAYGWTTAIDPVTGSTRWHVKMA
ncbi:MAG: PQQ-binding-like beta-propeller repeat protein, partial [Vulcanimicrobiaceae bacterium]